mgnify:FL=1
MEAFSFGSYYPGDSAIHRLDPRTKLLLGFVFLITTLTVSGFRGLAPVAIFVVLIYAVSRVPLRRSYHRWRRCWQSSSWSRCSTCLPIRVGASCGSSVFCR